MKNIIWHADYLMWQERFYGQIQAAFIRYRALYGHLGTPQTDEGFNRQVGRLEVCVDRTFPKSASGKIVGRALEESMWQLGRQRYERGL